MPEAEAERYAYSKLTDTWYIVHDWEELGDGSIRAKSKDKVDREDVPQEWIEAVDERPQSADAERSEIEERLPLGFNVILRADIWPHGDGVVHNEQDPCHNAPESPVRTDLHTVPSAGKKLCWDCEWPENAEEALNYDD